LIPVIDVFAGPGGLSEGFSTCEYNGKKQFRISLSIEKDAYAYQTLLLRSFYRQFDKEELPEDYFSCLRGEMKVAELFQNHPEAAEAARQQAWHYTLGSDKGEVVDITLKAALNAVQNWVLLGGPPCQAYSIVGRSRRGGINPNDERVHLYQQYYRILASHSPAVFILENVKGLLSSRLENEHIFRQILDDLADPAAAYSKLLGEGLLPSICPGYRIYSLVKSSTAISDKEDGEIDWKDYIVKSEEYGLPQARHRVILLGIRRDINVVPSTINRSVGVGVADVINDLPKLRSGISGRGDSCSQWLRLIKGFKLNEEDIPIGDLETRVGVLQLFRKIQKGITVPAAGRGNEFIGTNSKVQVYSDWYHNPRIKGVCNHITRSHMEQDLYRYLYASCFAKINGFSPKLQHFPRQLLPAHSNVRSDKLSEQMFDDRFRVQLADQSSSTITSHISKDGHYYIHPDPTQCRSLTVREAARLQTFPDDYYFCGPRTAQYVQAGNAVPPLLARQIAEIVVDIFNQMKEKQNLNGQTIEGKTELEYVPHKEPRYQTGEDSSVVATPSGLSF
jgi:DNA (cytosine-5)-methyltransferase 1